MSSSGPGGARASSVSLIDDDAARTARLLFDPELTGALLTPGVLERPALLRSLRTRVACAPLRQAQRLAVRSGRLDPSAWTTRRLLRARRRVLGPDAAGPPRFLVRVDEFPHWRAGDEPQRFGTAEFARFHAVMRGAGVPYLAAIIPSPGVDPTNPGGTRRRELDAIEREMLARLAAEDVTFGMHGLDHRTRDARPRHHGELFGLGRATLAARLDDGLGALAELGVRTDILVPPWNRFDTAQWPELAARFAVVCGGPESIRHLGLLPGPVWHDDAVYLPSYPPFYEQAAAITPAARAAIDQQPGTWISIVLHWGWEQRDDFTALRHLLDVIAPHVAAWPELMAAVARSAERPDPTPHPVGPHSRGLRDLQPTGAPVTKSRDDLRVHLRHAAHRVSRLRLLTKRRILRDYGCSLRERPGVYLRYLLLDPELESFSYEISNDDELCAFAASTLGVSEADARTYLHEARTDPELTTRLRARTRRRLDVKTRLPLGNRLLWYVVVRARKPELIVETGIYAGLGSLVLLRALERNAQDGVEGRLISIDIDPRSGLLVGDDPVLRRRWTKLSGLTGDLLPAAIGDGRVGLLLQDTPHTEANQRHEFGAALRHAADPLILMDPSGGYCPTMRELGAQLGLEVHCFHDRPRDHFYPHPGQQMLVIDADAAAAWPGWQ